MILLAASAQACTRWQPSMSESTPRTDLDVTSVDVSAYTIPTELPEADGTLAWDKTTVVVVQVQLRNGGRGLGFAYGQA